MDWLWQMFRRVMAPAVPANVNPNPAPSGPPPIVQSKVRTVPIEPDLEFVGTRDLYEQIASRYDGSVLICVRHSRRDDGSCSVVFLTNGIGDAAEFLRSAATLTTQTDIREIREDDL